MAVHGIEVDARRGRDAGFLQQFHAEAEAVIGETRNVGVDVEGAVRRRDPVEAEARQGLQQQRPVRAVDIDMPLKLHAAVHRDQAGMLGE